ncbi:MAG: sugar phosphate isomerase/epimerase, partial [DPANN group archaeon]|nr:sugar phosphate isomerase/epimerase [DPANN group archaeon]
KIEDPFGIKFERGMTDKFVGGRVPEIDSKTGRFKTRYQDLEYFEKEAFEYNRSFSNITGQKPDYYNQTSGREMYMKSTMQTQAGYSLGWALQFSNEVPGYIERIKRLKKLRKHYETIDRNLPEEEKWKLLKQDATMAQFTKGLLGPEMKDPLAMINEEISHQQKLLEYAQQSGNSQELQAMDTIETMKHLKTPEKYFEKNFVNYYALAGLRAMDQSRDTSRPVVLTLEHIFPERFGGHPQELKWIIRKARERMVDFMTKKEIPKDLQGSQWHEQMVKSNPQYGSYNDPRNPNYRPGISREEAEKIAAQHIKATIDTGHLNMWRKYWQNDPDKSPEQNQQAFNKWAVGQMESLAKDGYIGNVHMSDNYGFEDEHLAPGQGNSPIKDIVKVIKKYGYDGAYTVEPGADASTDNSDFHGLMKTWRHFGSEVYGMGAAGTSVGAPPRNWGEVQNSYFGRSYPPNFVFGGYSPSNDWTLWSGVQLE